MSGFLAIPRVPVHVQMSMTTRKAVAALTLAAFIGITPSATTPLMPLDEIRPGMVGVGRTVFEGSDLQEFDVHILGVLRNVQGPKRNLILARLEGGPLAQTGVAQGMSGSPVYIDGRLIGAVSYSIGAFSREPIAGITPIAEMKDATAMAVARAANPVRLELPITRENLTAALNATYTRLAPFASRPADVQGIGIPAAAGAQLGAMMRPISTPLLMGGFEPAIADLLAGAFRDSGFTPVISGAAAGDLPVPAGPLREGDAVGVSLIGGDLEMGATGTVTHIDGDRVYAFGHPFYNLGPTAFPMTRAHVHTMLPSLMSSFKISSLGATIGTMQQDRATAIAGTLGAGPALVPMTITLESSRDDGSSTSRTVQLRLVKDQLFTPLLAYVAMFNTLGAYERQYGAATIAVQSRTRLAGHDDLVLEDVYASDNPILGASTAIAGPLTALLGNTIADVEIEGLDVTVTTAETPRIATIERVWLDDIRPRAGRTVTLNVLTRTYRGDAQVSTVPLEIPAHAPRDLTLLVSDGRQLNALEQRELRGALQPQSIAQLVRVFNDTRRSNRIYVRLMTGRAGAIVNGETMTALPPSVLSVLEADRNGGSFTPIRTAPLGEWHITTDSAVSGSRVLTISVEAR
jgi:hypothetical protein